MDPRIDVLRTLLEQHRKELSAAFESVPQDLRENRPAAGTWSAANLIEHLAITERSVAALVMRLVARAEPRSEDEAFDRASFEQDIDRPMFLDRSRKIRGPQPTGELSAPEAWKALDAGRRHLLAALDRAHGRRLEGLVRPHPATGEQMNAYQWLAFVGLHEGRHAAQLREIAASLSTQARPARTS